MNEGTLFEFEKDGNGDNSPCGRWKRTGTMVLCQRLGPDPRGGSPRLLRSSLASSTCSKKWPCIESHRDAGGTAIVADLAIVCPCLTSESRSTRFLTFQYPASLQSILCHRAMCADLEHESCAPLVSTPSRPKGAARTEKPLSHTLTLELAGRRLNECFMRFCVQVSILPFTFRPITTCLHGASSLTEN